MVTGEVGEEEEGGAGVGGGEGEVDAGDGLAKLHGEVQAQVHGGGRAQLLLALTRASSRKQEMVFFSCRLQSVRQNGAPVWQCVVFGCLMVIWAESFGCTHGISLRHGFATDAFFLCTVGQWRW